MPPERHTTKHHVGHIDDLTPGTCHIIDIEGTSIGIIRTNNDIYAIRNRCPHQGAEICLGTITGTMLPSPPNQLRYGHTDQVLTCPWHRWEFDITTGQSIGNATNKKLRTYKTEIADNHIYIHLPTKPTT